MIVVSDASLITALLTVDEVDILHRIFGEVIIPEAVADELRRTHQELPEWLRIERVSNQELADEFKLSVDAGEAEAIALAQELSADRLLIDERKGRKLAANQGIPVIGLLGVVLIAKQAKLIPSARELLQRLDVEAGVYLTHELIETALRSIGE